MNRIINLMAFVFLAIITFTFSSCEKDLYDEVIPKKNQGKINYKKIEELPYLIPVIDKFSKDYLSSKNTNKFGENLDLDLEHILEFVQSNGLKSYTINIKNVFGQNDEFYYENLQIYEKQDIYSVFIYKYSDFDKTKPIDIDNFTGKLEVFDKDNVFNGIIEYELGQQKIVKFFGECFWTDCDGNIYLLYDCITSGGGGSSSSGTGGNTGGLGTGGSSGGGGSTTPNNNSTPSSNEVPLVVVPNVPTPTEQFIINLGPVKSPQFHALAPIAKNIVLNYVSQNLNNPEELLEMHTILSNVNLNIIKTLTSNDQIIIFNDLIANAFSPSNTILTNQALNEMLANPTVFSSIAPLIIEKNINDSQLDDCTKGILNKLKTNHAIANIIARFDNPNSIFNLNINQGTTTVINGTIRLGETGIGSGNLTYDITLNENYFNNNGMTNLMKAKTIVHEIIHALILSVVSNQYQPNNPDIEDFQAIWNAFIQHEYNDLESAHHEFMGNNYVNIIASALQEYDTGIPVNDGDTINQIYKDLAWSGLIKVPSNTPTPFDNIITPADKLRFLGRWNAEITRLPYNGVNPSSNNPCLN